MEELNKDTAQDNVREAEVVSQEEETLKTEETPQDTDKKIKNLISISILLGGLFLGSLFVDVAQLFSGRGFSPRALKQADVFESDGKTWVAYSDPVIRVKVLTDDTCAEETCKPDEALVGIRRILPTMLVEKVDANSEEGKAFAEKMQIRTVPAFVFAKEIDKTEFFAQAQPIFIQKEDGYVLDTAQVGIPAGKYISTPDIGDSDIQIGSKESKVKVVEFSDFQCPYCKVYHQTVISKLLKEYGDKILFSFKQLPLPSNPQAINAALASECANEQGKFVEYSDKLFSAQDEWGKTSDTKKFKDYARQLKLDENQFNSCIDEKKYEEKIRANQAEAQSFGISGTPATFVNDQFQNGLVKYEDLKKTIDEQLAK